MKVWATDSLLCSRFLGCHAMLPPKKLLLTCRPYSFDKISQSQLPLHFQACFHAKFALETCPIRDIFFVFASHCGRCHKWTWWRLPANTPWISRFCLGLPNNRGNTWSSFVCSKFLNSMLIRSLQFEKIIVEKEDIFLTCLIKKPGNQD